MEPTTNNFLTVSLFNCLIALIVFAGVYLCLANNGVGDPAQAEIQLSVLCKFLAGKLTGLGDEGEGEVQKKPL